MSSGLKYRQVELTDVGLVRAANEDAYGSKQLPWGSVWVLCDGMGGHVGGATASKIGVESVLEMLSEDPGEDIQSALEHAITYANDQIFGTALQDPSLKGMGSTCVTVVLRGDSFWVGHVGDSRAYLWSSNQLHRLTRDHSFVQGLVDEGILDEEKAEEHPRKNELLQALGVRRDVNVEVTASPIHLRPGDTILICSDGLNGMTGDRGIIETMRVQVSLEAKGAALIDLAKENGGHDNITVQLIEVIESPHKSSVFKAIKPKRDLSKTSPSLPPYQEPSKSIPKSWVYGGLAAIPVLIFLLYWAFSNPGSGKNPHSSEDSLRAADSVKMAKMQVKDSLEVMDTSQDSIQKDTPKPKLPAKPEPKKAAEK